MLNVDTSIAASDLRTRFFALLDSLSALRLLSLIDLREVSEEALLKRALNILLRHEDVDACSIFGDDGEGLRCVASTDIGHIGSGVVVERTYALLFDPGEGLIGEAYENGRLEYCRNCLDDERYLPFRGTDLAYTGGSMMALPIASGEQVLAVLLVAHHRPEHFEPWHQSMLTLFAVNVGQMLNNHRLLHNLENQVRERTRQLEQALAESEYLSRRCTELVSVDEMTGLKNRQYLFTEGCALLARARRQGSPVALLSIDLDYFKQVNESLGYKRGDEVLNRVAGVLKKQSRSGDIIARSGGEEFCLLLPDTTREGAEVAARRIQDDIESLDIDDESVGLNLTVSIGIASWDEVPEGDLTIVLNGLFSQADMALYNCKALGGNRRFFFHEGMSSRQA